MTPPQGYVQVHDQAPAFWQVDILWLMLATGEQTGGAYALMWELCPKDAGPGPHFHDQDEAFYVLDGAITFQLGDQTLAASGGAFVSIPRGTVHAFRIDSETATVLNFYAPAGFERTIAALGTPAARRTLPPKGLAMVGSDPAKVMALFGQVGMHPVQAADLTRPGGATTRPAHGQ